MPRPKGPVREKAIYLRVSERDHRLVSALAVAVGKTVQDTMLDLVAQGAKALKVSVPDIVPANQLALAFKRGTQRTPSGGMGTRKHGPRGKKKGKAARGVARKASKKAAKAA